MAAQSELDDLNDILTIVNVLKLVENIKKMKARERTKRRRSCWRRKWVARRELGRGALHFVHNELALEDQDSFKNYLRMDQKTFDKLLGLLDAKIKKQDTHLRESISSRDRLTVTLRFLATGDTYTDLSYSTRIAPCTISLIVPEVCKAIYDVLTKDYMKVPSTEEEWKKVADEFLKSWNYPNCLGAMDGRHIAFRAPRKAGSTYWCYKSFHSIVLLALVDANYRFLFVDCGTNGRVSDGGVFRECNLSQRLNSNTLNIPPSQPLPDREVPVPHVIVADDAFGLSEHVMKPYPLRNLSPEERIHNYRLSRARRIVENAFGILANRFRVLLTTINLKPETVKIITLASCALHNFLRTETMSTYMPPESIDREGEGNRIIPGEWRVGDAMREIGQQGGNRMARTPLAIREEFKNYFNNEGAVSWQDDYVFRV